MKVGLFTDTYAPQISGVCTSILTLKEELEKQGHEVFVFTTTDPLVTPEIAEEEAAAGNIIRLRSVPFISMPERRFVMVGLPTALKIARRYDLDIIHTQTEFGLGILGKIVANRLGIPVIHTMHTKYEDYLHYIAGGRLLRPGAVKYVMRTFLLGTEAVICPSPMTEEAVRGYGVRVPIRVIPTGIEVDRFRRPDITAEESARLREALDITRDETMLLSVSRLSKEKNIQAVLKALPEVVRHVPVRLVIVGEGPYREDLENLVLALRLEDYVDFVGAVENEETVRYYKAADFFISASTSETQGLTFSEALAAGTPVLASENAYLRSLVDDRVFGRLFAGDEEISGAILAAIKERVVPDPEVFEAKIYEISATNFGRKVARFYETLIEYYRTHPHGVSGRLYELSEGSLVRLSNLTESAGGRLSDLTERTQGAAEKAAESVKSAPVRLRKRGSLFAKRITKYVKIRRKEK
jgi:1,2-diacylglycerol 3-alpha-glucosyltransferase